MTNSINQNHLLLKNSLAERDEYDAVFLGKPLSSFYFFMCLMLLGYRCYKRKINHFFWWFTAIASLTFLLYIKSAWSLKCACAFLINALLAIIIGILLQKMMGIIHHQVEIFSHIVLKYIKNICYTGAKDATN